MCGEAGTRGGENAQGDAHKKKKRPTDLKKSVGQCLPDGEDVVEPGDGVLLFLDALLLQLPDEVQVPLRVYVAEDFWICPGQVPP